MTKVYIETVGCSQNFADSEQMAGLLQEAQFTITKNFEEADVVIFNTCTVKGPTETAFFKRLKEVKENFPYKTIIIAGCIAQTEFLKLQRYPLVGTNKIHHIVEIVEEAINDNVIALVEKDEVPPLNLPRIRSNSIISIIPISRGCLNNCTFCKTKAARGNLISYQIKEIKKETELAIRDGAKEIWLTSQDAGCYGFDIDTTLPKLIQELVKIPYEFKIRIGLMNPDHLLKIKDELLNLFCDQNSSKKLFKFLHIPVQSGDDTILQKMNRTYRAKDYFNIIQEIKEKYPHLTIATDIIVGFPTETEEQYWNTLKLVRETTPDIVNSSIFWPRSKTAAAKFRQLPGKMIKHRSKIITDICHNIFKMQNEKWLHWQGEIIIDEFNQEKNQWIGRNEYYKQVIIKNNPQNIPLEMGQQLKVKIKKTNLFCLEGEIIS